MIPISLSSQQRREMSIRAYLLDHRWNMEMRQDEADEAGPGVWQVFVQSMDDPGDRRHLCEMADLDTLPRERLHQVIDAPAPE